MTLLGKSKKNHEITRVVNMKLDVEKVCYGLDYLLLFQLSGYYNYRPPLVDKNMYRQEQMFYILTLLKNCKSTKEKVYCHTQQIRDLTNQIWMEMLQYRSF